MKTIFEKILAKETPATIIYEDQEVLAFLDIFPKAYGHTLVIPKVKSTSMLDIKDKDLSTLMIKANLIAKALIKQLGVDSYQIHVNNGVNSGQEVFYMHVHIIPTTKNNDKKEMFKISKLG